MAPLVSMSMMPSVPLPSPASESVFDVMFPGFSWDSFIARVSILQFVEYIGSVFLSDGQATPSTCALYLLGASWGPAIATGQIHRLIFPVMLHANALHIFFNVIFQSRIGFTIEKQFGKRKFVLLYLFCGFFGNLISVALDPYKLAVGASTSGFGLVGVWLAEVLLTYHLMGDARWRVFLWFGMMLTAVCVMSVLAPNLDIVGHLAGMLGGFLLTAAMSEMHEDHKPAWFDVFTSTSKHVLLALVALGLGKVLLFSPHTPLPECGSIFHLHSMM